TRQNVPLINVSQTGNDTKHHGDHVAGFAFRSLHRAALPITAVAPLGALWQKMPAIRTWHFVVHARVRLNRWRIRVFHLHTYRNSQAAWNSSSKEKFSRGKPRITQILRKRRFSRPFISGRRFGFHIPDIRVMPGRMRFLLLLTFATHVLGAGLAPYAQS